MVELSTSYWTDVIGEPTHTTCGVEHYHSRAEQGNIGEDCDPHLHIHFHWDTNKNPINFIVAGKAAESQEKMRKFMSGRVTAWKKKLKVERPDYDWTAKTRMALEIVNLMV